MPTTNYNGRYLGTGNGGYAGGFFFSELADGINRVSPPPTPTWAPRSRRA
jgi:hypothetical protein